MKKLLLGGVGVAVLAALMVAGATAFLQQNTAGTSVYGQTSTLPKGVVEYVYPTSNVTSSISAKLGETFVIQLSSNAGSTGYDWKVSTSTGIQYLNYTVVSTSKLLGGPQVRNYFFSAVQAGTQTITLQDQRSFAPYSIAATINLQVAVS